MPRYSILDSTELFKYSKKSGQLDSPLNFYILSWVKLLRSRNSHQRCSMKEGVIRSFTKFTEKHLCQSLFFNKVAGLRPATLLKKRI